MFFDGVRKTFGSAITSKGHLSVPKRCNNAIFLTDRPFHLSEKPLPFFDLPMRRHLPQPLDAGIPVTLIAGEFGMLNFEC